jgi:hypothetical protein
MHMKVLVPIQTKMNRKKSILANMTMIITVNVKMNMSMNMDLDMNLRMSGRGMLR